MTNKEWLNTLSSKELAAFLTCGLPCVMCRVPEGLVAKFIVDFSYIRGRYIDAKLGLENWLEQEQEFEVFRA